MLINSNVNRKHVGPRREIIGRLHGLFQEVREFPYLDFINRDKMEFLDRKFHKSSKEKSVLSCERQGTPIPLQSRVFFMDNHKKVILVESNSRFMYYTWGF